MTFILSGRRTHPRARPPESERKVYLVTGASSGIGRATTLALLRRGHHVYAAARRVGLMDDLADAGARVLNMDVTNDAAVEAGVATIIAERGRIDGLLANAGYVQMGMIETVSVADAQRQFDVNVFGVARAIKAVLPHMRAQRSGSIVITSSIVGKIPVPGMAWYPASKHALEGIADALRMEVRRFGIKVAVVEPGFVETGLLEASMPTLDKAERAEHAPVYAAEQAHFRGKFTASFLRGIPVEKVASIAVEALGGGSPKRRYWPTLTARFEVWIREKVGDAVLDRVLPPSWLGVRGTERGRSPSGVTGDDVRHGNDLVPGVGRARPERP
jgi:NAD(P)-dependent dehydrogenase (short-subunit alcohol dehydrogenase family)